MFPIRLLGVVAACALATPLASAATITVPQDFPTIQAAVDSAVPFDVIVVGKGVYDETVVIDGKVDLTIRGAKKGKVVLDNDFHDDGFWVRNGSTRVVIEDFVIREVYGYGVRLNDSSDCKVIHCDIYDTINHGIGAFDSSDLTIEENLIRRTGWDNGGYGVRFDSTGGSVISNNVFLFLDGDAIDLDIDSSLNEVSDNTIRDVQNGVRLDGLDNDVLRNTILEPISRGIVVSARSVVLENTIFRPGDDGIEVDSGGGSTIDGNTIEEPADDGIDVDVNDCFLTGNTVIGAWDDAFSVGGSDNLFTGNTAKYPRDDGFEVRGEGNGFVDNVVKKAGSNGFELRTGGNAFDGNSATKCGNYDMFDLTIPGSQTFSGPNEWPNNINVQL